VVAVEPATGLTINYGLAVQYNYMFDGLVPSYFYPSYVYSMDLSLDPDYIDDLFENINILSSKKHAI